MTTLTQGYRAAALISMKYAVLAGALLAGTVAAMAQNTSPVGTWQTIDDHTGQPKALVRFPVRGLPRGDCHRNPWGADSEESPRRRPRSSAENR